jgi:ATP-dependent helicase HrpB
VREVEGRDRELNTILSLATAIEADWLRDLFPDDFTVTQGVFYDAAMKRVCAEEQVRFRGLTLSTRRIEPPPAGAAAAPACGRDSVRPHDRSNNGITRPTSG